VESRPQPKIVPRGDRRPERAADRAWRSERWPRWRRREGRYRAFV